MDSSSNHHIDNQKELIKNEEYIKGHSEALSKNQTKIILDQIDKSICKIEKENSTGTGFLCIIQNNELFEFQPVLVTSHHVLGFNDIKEGNVIKFFLKKKHRKYIKNR